MKIALLLSLVLLTTSPAWAATTAPPTVNPATPSPSQIPLDSNAPQPQKASKADKDKQYTFLVIGAALLPIAIIVGYKLFKQSAPSGGKTKQRYRYSAGPADPRRIARRNQPKKPRDKKMQDRYYR